MTKKRTKITETFALSAKLIDSTPMPRQNFAGLDPSTKKKSIPDAYLSPNAIDIKRGLSYPIAMSEK